MSFLKNIVRAFPFKAPVEKTPSLSSPKVMWSKYSINGLKKGTQLIERRQEFDEIFPYNSCLGGHDTEIAELAEAIINNKQSIDSVEHLCLLPSTIMYILSSYCPIFPSNIENSQSLKDALNDLPPNNRDALDCIVNHLCNLMQDKSLIAEQQITQLHLFQRVGSVIFQIKSDGNRLLGNDRDIELRRNFFLNLLESHQKPAETSSMGNTIQDRSVKVTFQDLSNRPNQEQLKSVLSPFGNIANIGFKEKIAVVLFSDWSEALCCAQEIQNIDVGFDLKVKYLGSHKWSELIAVKQRREENAPKEKIGQKPEPQESHVAVVDSAVPVAPPTAISTSEGVAPTKGNGGGWAEARRVQTSPKLSTETDAKVFSSATSTFSKPPVIAAADPEEKVDDDEKIEVSSIHSVGGDAVSSNGRAKVSAVDTVPAMTKELVIPVDPKKSISPPEKDRKEQKKMIFFDYNDINVNDDMKELGERVEQSSPAVVNNRGKYVTKPPIHKHGLAASKDNVDAEVLRVSFDGKDTLEKKGDTAKEPWKSSKALGVSPTSLTSGGSSSPDKKSLERVNSIASSVDVIEPYASSSEDEHKASIIGPQSHSIGGSSIESKPAKVAEDKSPQDKTRISSDNPQRDVKVVTLVDNMKRNYHGTNDSDSSYNSANKESKTTASPNFHNLQSEVHPDRSQRRKKKKTTLSTKPVKEKGSDSLKESEKRNPGHKDRREAISSESEGSSSSSSVEGEYHRKPAAYVLPSQFKNQQEGEETKLSEKLVQISFESQNREEQLHQLQLKNFELCEESWAAEIVKLSLRNTSLMEENNALREAMRKLKLELSTTTAVLLAAEASKKSLEVQLKALQERANREALSTVLTQNKMIATLESRLKDSESQHHVMEAEMLHTKSLHEKAVESVLYWKSMALRQGGDNSSTLNENVIEVAKKETSSSSVVTITGDNKQGKHEGPHYDEMHDESSFIEDGGRLQQATEDIKRPEGAVQRDEALALTESENVDLPTLKKATEQELQDYVQKLPVEPYIRSDQTYIQDPGAVSSSKSNQVSRSYKQPTHQVWKVSQPGSEQAFASRIASGNNSNSNNNVATPRNTGMVTGTSKVAGVENIPPRSYQELVSSVSSFTKPPPFQSPALGNNHTIDFEPESVALQRRPSTALARLAAAHSRGFKTQPAKIVNQPPIGPKWSSAVAPIARNSERTEEKDSNADRAMLYYSHLFPAEPSRLEEHHNRMSNISQLRDMKAFGDHKKAPVTRSKELQNWFSHHYE